MIILIVGNCGVWHILASGSLLPVGICLLRGMVYNIKNFSTLLEILRTTLKYQHQISSAAGHTQELV